ncbi:MAG TPA: aromatic ring-hydroxylating dioxygenase subunit alpha [Bryobacteraceae bacterium]|nr:aromatic ring-hydroxylating dioxygenase subunit alpha [Bryobacteraceae bacterium]
MVTPAPKTLPARYYTDPELFQQEVERFYFGSWICAGRTEQIREPGEYFLRDVCGESIILTRDNDGALRAFYNVCRHRGTRMCVSSEGKLAGRIQCPYHGWTYGLDGNLIGAPQMDPADFSRQDYPLHAVACDVWDGHIFLNLSPPTASLADQLDDLPKKFAHWQMHDLRVHKRIVYDVRANWKLVTLNYNECLHCPLLHPALNRLTDYLGAANEPAHPTYVGGSMGFRGDVETMSVDGKRRRDYLPGLNEEERKKVCYYTIYPNFLLSLHPDYMMTHTLWPKAVDRTEIICEWHFHPDEMARFHFQPNDAIDFWDQTNREDWGIVELSQAGIQSRAYTPGPYSRREELLHQLDQNIISAEKS